MENIENGDSKLNKKFQFELEREKIRSDFKLELEKEKCKYQMALADKQAEFGREKSKYQIALADKQAEIEKEKSKTQLTLAERQAEIERIKSDSQKAIADIQAKHKLDMEALHNELVREGKDMFSLSSKAMRDEKLYPLYRRIITLIAILIFVTVPFYVFKDLLPYIKQYIINILGS